MQTQIIGLTNPDHVELELAVNGSQVVRTSASAREWQVSQVARPSFQFARDIELVPIPPNKNENEGASDHPSCILRTHIEEIS